MINIQILPVGIIQANCYIVSKTGNTNAIVIDAGGSPQKILDALNRAGLSLSAILLTHGHYDHCAAVSSLVAACPSAKIYFHSAELALINSSDNMATLFRSQLDKFEPSELLTDGSIIEEAGIVIKTIHTPGHTIGSVCYQIEDALFTGDTLFCMSIGRTDMPTGSSSQLASSLRRLFALPQNLRVFPGHEEQTDLDFERKNNPYANL